MKIVFANIIITLLVLSGCSEKPKENASLMKSNSTENIQVKETFLILTDTENKKIKIEFIEGGAKFEGYENKIVILNFFATWCPPCKAEIPHLNNLQEKYKNDVKIITVLLEENKTNDEIKSFMKDFDIHYTITNSPENFKLAEQIGGVKSIPFMLMYDKNSKYFQHYTGAIPEEMIDSDIQKVLN